MTAPTRPLARRGAIDAALAAALAAGLLGTAAGPAMAQAQTQAQAQAQTQPSPLAAPPLDVEEVPFITTPDHVTLAMLALAGVGAADHVIDLGSGDGRIVITAARRFGASGLGVEIDPALVARSSQNARVAGVAARVEFRTQDLFDTPLARASVITMYLLPQVNMALRPRLLALAPGTRIVSHDWDLGDWQPDHSLTVAVPDKAVGLEKFSRLHLWTVPARLQGLWCGDGGVALRLVQQHQQLTATLDSGAQRRGFSGRIDGASLQLLGAAGAGWSAQRDGDGLRIVTVSAGLALHSGQRLRPAPGEACAGPGPGIGIGIGIGIGVNGAKR